jgi:hypothetical protein
LKTLYTWLHDWGFSPEKPAKKVMEQNPELARKWLDEEYPAIERRAHKEKAEIKKPKNGLTLIKGRWECFTCLHVHQTLIQMSI